MVTSGSEIFDPLTGQRTIIRKTGADTGGAYVEMESFHRAHVPAEPMHVHPFQESSFQMLSGTLHVQIADHVIIIGPGERAEIPRNVPHTFWNDGDEEAREIQVFRPALNIDDFFVTYFALTQAGKINDAGMPKSIFLLAVLMQEYDRVMRVIEPARWMQVLLMRTLGPIGRLLGYHKQIRAVAATPHPPAIAPITR